MLLHPMKIDPQTGEDLPAFDSIEECCAAVDAVTILLKDSTFGTCQPEKHLIQAILQEVSYALSILGDHPSAAPEFQHSAT